MEQLWFLVTNVTSCNSVSSAPSTSLAKEGNLNYKAISEFLIKLQLSIELDVSLWTSGFSISYCYGRPK